MNTNDVLNKLIAEIERRLKIVEPHKNTSESAAACRQELIWMKYFILSHQHEQPDNMIQWTGSNLKEVIDFTGKSPKFGEWFKSWDEFESYVHSHGDILKLFSDDGSHFEVPVGAWIVKTPDGYNVPSVARFIHAKQEQPEVDLAEEITRFFSKNPIPHEHITDWPLLKNTAIHFYELGLNARKEQPEGGCSEKPNNLLRKQPEVDLEREIKIAKNADRYLILDNGRLIEEIARYFYDLGRARKEQPELDIDILCEWSMRYAPDIRPAIESTAYHFWNMARYARKEE